MQPSKKSRVFLLGYNKPLKWENNGKGFIVEIPKSTQKNPLCNNAWVLKFQVE